MSINKCIFIGNLTRDPEIKYMSNGEAVANASIACNERWKDKSGQQQEKVEYVNLTFYRRLAEIAGEYLKKGSLIYVEGKLSTRKWQDNDGNDRYTTGIIVGDMRMLSGKPDEPRGDNSAQPAAADKQRAPDNHKTKGGFEPMDDDIPF